MKVVHTRWMLFVIYATLIIIDVIDGDLLKITTTVLLTLSVMAFSFGYTSSKQRAWFTAGLIFGALAMAGFIYRLVLFSRTESL